jgi:hypothetical protein
MRSLIGGGRARAVVLSHFVEGLDPDDEATLLDLLHRASPDPPAGTSPLTPPPETTAPGADGPVQARDASAGEQSAAEQTNSAPERR